MTQKSKILARVELLRARFYDVSWFSKQILTKWVFWLFLILDIIAVVVQYFSPNLRLPQYVYVSLALIGFFWAGFKVNQELLSKYKALVNDPSKTVIEPKTSLSLSLIEGNEYSYELSEPYETPEAREIQLRIEIKEIDGHYDESGILHIGDKVFYSLPNAEVMINLRIENDGNTPLDILKINSIVETIDPIIFYSMRVLVENRAVSYPKHLEPREIFLCQIRTVVGDQSGVTMAQFAAGLRSIKKEVSNSIAVDILDKNGNRKNIKLVSKIALRPLVDLYISQWQSYKQSDLLRLAGIGTDRAPYI